MVDIAESFGVVLKVKYTSKKVADERNFHSYFIHIRPCESEKALRRIYFFVCKSITNLYAVYPCWPAERKAPKKVIALLKMVLNSRRGHSDIENRNKNHIHCMYSFCFWISYAIRNLTWWLFYYSFYRIRLLILLNLLIIRLFGEMFCSLRVCFLNLNKF